MTARKRSLTLVTCQAANTVPISRAIAGYLSDRMPETVEFIEDIPWQDAYHAITSGEIDIGWICGRPYVHLVDELRAPIRLLAAPVMGDLRYRNQPIYYSDVVVRRESPFAKFEDLYGAIWAYNEPGSQSGYHITCYNLSALGEDQHFFGDVIESGSHARSIKMILEGEVDASAIDSTLLEWLMTQDPLLRQKLRVIASWGPSPIPPLVATVSLGEKVFHEIQSLLLDLENSAAGQTVLSAGHLRRFIEVADADFNPIRQMAIASRGINLKSRIQGSLS
jgi:phosphonate transport system substrate-binding protein